MNLLKTNSESTEFPTREISLTKTSSTFQSMLGNTSYPIKAEQTLKQQKQIKWYFLIGFLST